MNYFGLLYKHLNDSCSVKYHPLYLVENRHDGYKRNTCS